MIFPAHVCRWASTFALAATKTKRKKKTTKTIKNPSAHVQCVYSGNKSAIPVGWLVLGAVCNAIMQKCLSLAICLVGGIAHSHIWAEEVDAN